MSDKNKISAAAKKIGKIAGKVGAMADDPKIYKIKRDLRQLGLINNNGTVDKEGLKEYKRSLKDRYGYDTQELDSLVADQINDIIVSDSTNVAKADSVFRAKEKEFYNYINELGKEYNKPNSDTTKIQHIWKPIGNNRLQNIVTGETVGPEQMSKWHYSGHGNWGDIPGLVPYSQEYDWAKYYFNKTTKESLYPTYRTKSELEAKKKKK